jgi:hypothetical protein
VLFSQGSSSGFLRLAAWASSRHALARRKLNYNTINENCVTMLVSSMEYMLQRENRLIHGKISTCAGKHFVGNYFGSFSQLD